MLKALETSSSSKTKDVGLRSEAPCVGDDRHHHHHHHHWSRELVQNQTSDRTWDPLPSSWPGGPVKPGTKWAELPVALKETFFPTLSLYILTFALLFNVNYML